VIRISSIIGSALRRGHKIALTRIHIPAHAKSGTAVSPMQPIISVKNLSKTYATGATALRDVNLEIRRGEIFALLGPNGAGKTTLIGIICGIVNPSSGQILVDGHDIIRD
jgi:ABC-type bacteriocin/lantibiotic exporter with double-glycine peptidase domain